MLAHTELPPRLVLKTVTIERFKAAFRPGPVELQPLNLLIGRNGSGKSTLLEALQWLDRTIRQDARTASDRYFGARDLINLRGESAWFSLKLTWQPEDAARDPAREVSFEVKVTAQEDGTPAIVGEWLWTGQGRGLQKLIDTEPKPAGIPERVLFPQDKARRYPFFESDRLALSRGDREDSGPGPTSGTGFLNPFAGVLRFFRDAVFLRLSPNRLADGSLAKRRSFDPLLDEEGQMLPALLLELSQDQRQELVERLRQVLQGMQGVQIDAPTGRDTKVNYALLERMPYRGRAGRKEFPIPSWMLSEGTRRITALFALLIHDPPPSLLCIEEVENGLDPLTTVEVLRALQDAASRGTQVLMTTHNPWLLDHVEPDTVFLARRQGGNTVYQKFKDLPEVKDFAADVPMGTRYVTFAREVL
ncbi:MAG TPA: AAA family ATPase [Pseudomonadota bacterium]|nr:AAA family ATPase [Pseudomonadota bacterium]